MQYEYVEKGKCVFKEGEPSNKKFYVIISGEIGVFVCANFFSKDNSKGKSEQKPRSELNLPSISSLLDEETGIRESSMASSRTNLPVFASTLQSLPDRPESLKASSGMCTPTQSLQAISMDLTKKDSKQKITERPKVRFHPASMNNLSEDPYAEYREKAKGFGNLVRVLSKGDSFGESGNCYMTNKIANVYFVHSYYTIKQDSNCYNFVSD